MPPTLGRNGHAGGAYGLKVTGVAESELLVRLPAGHPWPELSVIPSPERAQADATVIADREATVRLVDGSHVTLDRERRRAAVFSPPAANPGTVLDAVLTAAGIVFARWEGRDTFHAGAFVAGGAAWALMGDRRAGKSTLAASLALGGVPVLTDDLLVLAGARALSGPRVVDLRASAAVELGVQATAERVRGDDPRWRLALDQVEPEVPFAGSIFLRWARRVTVRELEPHQRLARLRANRMVTQPGTDPAQLLDLSRLPAFELERPRDWASMADTVERLLSVVAG